MEFNGSDEINFNNESSDMNATVSVFFNYDMSLHGNGTNGTSHQMSDAGYIFVGVMLTFTFVVGSFINGLCLFVFFKNKRLRSPTNMFIMSLNICDFFMSFTGVPMVMTSAFAHEWLWGDLGCDIEAFIVYFMGLTSMYVLMAISVDRYIAISKPLLGSRITKKIALIACGSCFAFGFFWSILPAFGWNEYDLEGAGISCSVVWENPDPMYMSYIWTIFVVSFVIPVMIMIFAYYGVLATLRSLNKTSVWDMNSRVARRNLAIEKKMLKTAVLIVSSFLLCWTPYAVVSFVSAIHGKEAIPILLATIPPVIAKSQGLLNPIIYVCTNKQLQQAAIKLIPCESFRNSLATDKTLEAEQASFEESDAEEGGELPGAKKMNGNEAAGSSGDMENKNDGLAKKEAMNGTSGSTKRNAIHPAHCLGSSPMNEGVESDVSKLEVPMTIIQSPVQIEIEDQA